MATSIYDYQLRYHTHNEYNVNFYDENIHTLVTHDPNKVNEWISEIQSIHYRHLHRLIVGLDVEWRPNNQFHNNNPVATLQLCTFGRCLIFQLLYSSRQPQKLVDFLNDSDYTFVGVGVHGDVQKLQDHYGFRVGGNIVDLGVLAADRYGYIGLKNTGLKGLAKLVLGKEVEKPIWVTLSRWDQQCLTPEQVQYACVDAFVSYEIGRVLNAAYFSSQ